MSKWWKKFTLYVNNFEIPPVEYQQRKAKSEWVQQKYAKKQCIFEKTHPLFKCYIYHIDKELE